MRPLKVGLVGCGGRGTGAAADALTADSDTILHAVGDLDEAIISSALATLRADFGERVAVGASHIFTGLDAFQQVMATDVDVVLLATPPGFRPQHFAAAAAAGKHIFCEKPVAVDVPGVRQVLAAAKHAAMGGKSIVSGFCWRRCAPIQETMQRLREGGIGKVTSYYATYLTGPVKPHQPASQRPDGMSDVAWQIRNWYNYAWLSGDSLVEQAIHSVDKIGWAMEDADPLSCIGVGGRQIPADHGNIYDHFSVVYEYPNKVFATMASRQQTGCDSENADYLQGTKGSCTIRGNSASMSGESGPWRAGAESDVGMYVQEHVELFRAIRSGTPVQDTAWMCHSTLLAIMGRMAAYTGKRITWAMLMQSTDDLAPEDLAWTSRFPVAPLPRPGQI